MSGWAATAGDSRAVPYACRYAIRPPLTTATDALGTPVAASTARAVESTIARVAASRVGSAGAWAAADAGQMGAAMAAMDNQRANKRGTLGIDAEDTPVPWARLHRAADAAADAAVTQPLHRSLSPFAEAPERRHTDSARRRCHRNHGPDARRAPLGRRPRGKRDPERADRGRHDHWRQGVARAAQRALEHDLRSP